MGRMEPSFPPNNLEESWYDGSLPSSRTNNRMLNGSTFRAALEGVYIPPSMEAQPFHSKAPLPPHLKYKHEVSTYMDHFRKPIEPRRSRRNRLPQSLDARLMDEDNTHLSFQSKQPIPNQMKVFRQPPNYQAMKAKRFMESMHKTTNDYMTQYDARCDIPDKPADASEQQREYIRRIARDSYSGMGEVKARDAARANRAPDFYAQHRVHSAPSFKRLNQNNNNQRIDRPPSRGEDHWMGWKSGTPEPPGLQQRLHRPWPSSHSLAGGPARNTYIEQPASLTSSACLSRPASCCLERPNKPIPDAIGSKGIHPELRRGDEEAFSPEPPTFPVSESYLTRLPYPVSFG